MSTIQEIIQQSSRFEEETTKQLIGKAIEILNELAIRAYLDNDSCLNVDTSDNDLPAAQKSRREFNTRNGIRPEKHRVRDGQTMKSRWCKGLDKQAGQM